MRYAEFLNQIQQGRVDPVYFFHGEEPFLIEEAMATLKKKILEPGGMEYLNFHALSGPSTRTSEIIDHCQTLPCLAPRRLVLVREVDELPEIEGLVPYLDCPSDRTCLVLMAVNLDKRKRIFSLLRSKSAEVVFSPLNDAQLNHWIKERVRFLGLTLSPQALEYLGERLGNDLHQVQNELEKLSLIAVGPRRLEAEDLQSHLTGERDHSVFEWLDAVSRPDRDEALRLLSLLLDAGEHPLSLLGLLVSSLRRKGRSPKSANSGSPGWSSPGVFQSGIVPEGSDLVRGFTLCLKADSQLKGSKLSPKIILQDLIINLCREGKRGALSGIGTGSRGSFWS